MKSLVEFLNESKEKPMYSEWEIHNYVNYMVEQWIRNTQNYNNVLFGANPYDKIDLCKSCEIMVTLLECLSDVVKLHFVSARDTKPEQMESYTSENSFYRAFKVIESVLNINFNDDEFRTTEESKAALKKEVDELKQRVEKLVTDCNAKYDKWCEEQKKLNKDAECCCSCVPCGCIGIA